ncbi:unnamed protein product [Brassica oleracea var. botrytis]
MLLLSRDGWKFPVQNKFLRQLISKVQVALLCVWLAAIRKDHEKEGREIVQILLAAGADPSAQDAMHGRTALHTAAMSNNVELVRVILDAGVNANIQNMSKTIPLHLALAGADAAKKIRENLEWLVVMLRKDLMDALLKRGVHLPPTIYKIGDWVKFKRDVTTPLHGWQGANPKSVGFVQNILADNEDMIVAFCSGEARVLANEVVKFDSLGQRPACKTPKRCERAKVWLAWPVT